MQILFQIKQLLINKQVDILAISELWLTPKQPSSLFSIKGYNLVRNDRGLRPTSGKREYVQGGGVACFIRSELSYKVLEATQIQNINETEVLLLEIISSQRLLFGVLYRRPKGNVLTNFFNSLQRYTHLYDNVILAGDLNSDLLHNDYYGSHLRNILLEYSLHAVPYGATHYTDHSDTWLDLIFTDSSSKVVAYEKSSVPFINGHDYLLLIYEFNTPKRKVTF